MEKERETAKARDGRCICPSKEATDNNFDREI